MLQKLAKRWSEFIYSTKNSALPLFGHIHRRSWENSLFCLRSRVGFCVCCPSSSLKLVLLNHFDASMPRFHFHQFVVCFAPTFLGRKQRRKRLKWPKWRAESTPSWIEISLVNQINPNKNDLVCLNSKKNLHKMTFFSAKK